MERDNVRIDGSNNPELHRLSTDSNPPSRPMKPKDASSAEGLTESPATEASYQPYIGKAAACDEVDLQAIAEAQKLLASRQLDSTEAIRRAAEAMLKFGL